jgi:hypothetical protein
LKGSIYLATTVLLTIAGCSSSKQPTLKPSVRSEDTYMITAHTVVQLKPVYLGGYLQTGLPTHEDDYTVTYGADVLEVKYASSQTNTAKQGASLIEIEQGIHRHSRERDPDVSQVPQVGMPIKRCLLSKDVLPDGGVIIATQPTSEPCMVQIGDILQYEPSPNAGSYTNVIFDIVSESVR